MNPRNQFKLNELNSKNNQIVFYHVTNSHALKHHYKETTWRQRVVLIGK